MKDKILSRRLRRQNSTKSLAADFREPPELPRRDSATSLKSLGRDLVSSFKKKDPRGEHEDDSFEENGWLSNKSKVSVVQYSALVVRGGRIIYPSSLPYSEVWAAAELTVRQPEEAGGGRLEETQPCSP